MRTNKHGSYDFEEMRVAEARTARHLESIEAILEEMLTELRLLNLKLGPKPRPWWRFWEDES